MKTFERVNFFGIPVSSFKRAELKSFILSSISKSEKRVVYGFSLHSIYSLSGVPEIVQLGKNADVLLTDGRPFYWLLKLFKIPVYDSMSIPESVIFTLRVANEEKCSLMLLGSTDALNNRATENIRKEYPHIKATEGQHGYFDFSKDLDKVFENIKNNDPDILLVGMSSPLKEKFVFNHMEELSARIIIPCGGMIDVLAGKTKMTPPLLKKLGLASFYRVFQEPRRLLLDRLKFYFFVFFDLLPVLFLNALIMRKKDFSLIEHYQQ